jgi:alkyl hydroperoxide reductase subunit AhpC
MDIGNLGTRVLEKVGTILTERMARHRLEFTKISCSNTYSHYDWQNHVREGGEKRITFHFIFA